MTVFFLFIFFVSLIAWGTFFYVTHTHSIAKAGGEYIEGAVGQPVYINPVLSQADGIDGDLVELLFSGLVKYDGQGNIEGDLADHWDISEDNKEYTFYLRDNLKWHDGEALTARDIRFTFNTIQNSALRSPLRKNLQKVSIEVIDDKTVKFVLEEPLAPFLHNVTFGIIPMHIWENISEEKFSLSDYNLHALGSGPYKFQDFQKDSEGNILFYKLAANSDYYLGRPNISKITFNFYADEDSAIDAFNKKEIMGISSLSYEKAAGIKNQKSTNLHELKVPRYFAVFFNVTKSVPLSYDEVRRAFSLATDRNALVDTIFHGKADPVYSPILEGMLGYTEDIEKNEFNLDEANKILEEAGWTKDGDIRKKDDEELEVTLLTTDYPDLTQTAYMLKEQWEKVGARVEVDIQTIGEISQNYAKPREYEALVLGHRLSGDPDLYSFWHSSQKSDPGQNLAVFGNDEVDKLLEEARKEPNHDVRAEKYIEAQKIISQEIPAIFLYSPYYLYPVNSKVRGVDTTFISSASRRFSRVSDWYLKTKRVWNSQ